jgi:hypothetical protein
MFKKKNVVSTNDVYNNQYIFIAIVIAIAWKQERTFVNLWNL